MTNWESTKAKLNQMRELAMERKTKLARHVEYREEPLPADFAEQAVELENQETMVRLSEFIDVELQAIDKALIRIKAGHNGWCARCGEDIDPARIQALPTTDLCIGCMRASNPAE